ncbi:MAG: hypothetical protein UCH84_06005 [Eubacterium sp.]|nr:hypothetical protein [Eubacterium sp.]
MLNIEKYKEMLIDMEIIDVNKLAVVNDKPVNCTDLYVCGECDFGEKKNCEPYLEEWLFSEYEEPEVDWSKVKVDTPILVKNTEAEEWQKRHFARFKNGKVYAWYDGLTSWSTAGEDHVNFWKYAKLAESEEN